MAGKEEQVAGYIHNCIGYDPCPLCYGCRNFGRYIKCENKCGNNIKLNVCNKPSLHNETNYGKMIKRPQPIIIKDNYQYKE